MDAVAALEPAALVLWPLAKSRAQKRKTLTRAEATEALGVPIEDVPGCAWPIHVWCWVRGMPPLNVVVVKRGKTADPEGGFTATDYDVFHEALARSVYTLEDAWFYPWEKVPDPTPEQLMWSLDVYDKHRQLVWDFRFLDLELELRFRDEARGFKRPPPAPYATWKDAEQAHKDVLTKLATHNLRQSDLRPGGKGPYPPPRPLIGNWAD